MNPSFFCPKPASSQQTELFFKPEVLAGKAYSIDQLTECVKLDQNESDVGLPAELQELILKELSETPWHKYPVPYPVDLENKLCDDLGLSHGSAMFSDGKQFDYRHALCRS